MFELSFEKALVFSRTRDLKEMGLRAFFKNILRRGVLINVLSIAFYLTPTDALSQRSGQVPYEIKFADVTFQLNDLSRYLMSQEVMALQKNEEVKNNYLSRLAMILPVVNPIINEAAIPDDFKYLSIYNQFQNSLSSTNYLDIGVLWCMDMSKAKDVNLLINNEVDERKHLISSSKGALLCLRRNQVLYKNWGVTLFSHLASKEVLNQLEIARKWSGNYIVLDSPAYSSLLQFLAFKYVLENEFNSFKNPNPKIVYQYKQGAGKSLNIIAADLNLDPQELASTNLWLKTNKVPDKDLDVLIEVSTLKYNELKTLAEVSSNKMGVIADLGFPILAINPGGSKGKGGVFYSINTLKGIQAEMCDNYVTLAYKANLTPEKFLIYNDLTDKEFLNIGSVYYLETKNRKAAIPHHIVRDEETLWAISQQYGVKLSKLLKYNRIETVGRLQKGRLMWLQKKRPKSRQIEYIEIPTETKPEFPTNRRIEPVINKKEEIVLNNLDNNIESVNPKTKEEKYVPKSIEPNKPKQRDELHTAYIEKTTPQVQKKTFTKDSFDPYEKRNIVQNEPLEFEDKPIVRREVKIGNVETVRPFSEELKEIIENGDKRYVVHEVKKGETLYRISVNYRVSVNQLYRLNNLSNNTIEIGDKIIVKKY